MVNRRDLIKQAAALAACSAFMAPHQLPAALAAAEFPIATQQYPWGTFYGRSGKNAGDLKALLSDVASCGFVGYEPIAGSPEQIGAIAKEAKDNGLKVDSLYVNSTLHDTSQTQVSMESVVAIATAAKKTCGTKVIVTNPSPIQWGGGQDKSDQQLRTQAKALNQLGAKLRENGQVLAYHNHDAELRQGARELHHMLTATDPANVKFCLDAHWIYRGCGDSEVAVLDVVRLHRSRIVELHLRQSHDGVWDEAFGEGDIDYGQLAEMLADLPTKPLLVLEQCIEGKTPNTMDAVEAHQCGRVYAQQVFQRWASK